MLFANKPSRPRLRVIQMPLEDRRTYITERVDSLIQTLQSKYRVEIFQNTHYLGVKFDQCMVFEHPDGMFKVIDWSDRDRPDKMESADIIKHPNCQFVLKCQYNPLWRTPKLRPFFYFEKTKPRNFSESIDHFRSLQKTNNKLYWRGNMHVGRETVIKRVGDLLNEGFDQNIAVDEFYKELASHKIALSLPGLGKSCHREFECFAVGTVVISPKFQNIYHVPLIPNYHYLSVDWGTPDEIAASIRNRISTLEDSEIARIRANAIKYYDDNIRFESSIRWLEHLLEL